MARRRHGSDEQRGSLDSLLDTMTNVVGILIVVLIVTQLNVSSAAKRIRANLPEISREAMEELARQDEQQRRMLEGLQAPRDVDPRDLARLRDEVRELEELATPTPGNARRLEELTREIGVLREALERIRARHRAAGGQVARIREKIAETEAQARAVKPRMVRLPNPRVPEEGSREMRFIARGGRLLPYDRNALLDRLEARIKGRPALLSRKEPKRYDRGKIKGHLQTLQEIDPDYRLDFILHDNGHIHVHAYPRDGRGDALVDLARKDSGWWRRRAEASGERAHMRFWVAADSFDLYLAARRMAEEFQIPVGWVFAEATGRQVFNLAERGILAVPDPDYTPPERKPGPGDPPKKPVEDILD